MQQHSSGAPQAEPLKLRLVTDRPFDYLENKLSFHYLEYKLSFLYLDPHSADKPYSRTMHTFSRANFT